MKPFNKDMAVYESPNHSSRRGAQVVATILHYTAGTEFLGTLKWFQMSESKVSAHFVVSRDGVIVQLVDLAEAAWHAGRAEFEHNGNVISEVNSQTIGIELCNLGPIIRKEDSSFIYQLNDKQYPYRYSVEPVKAALMYEDGKTVDGYWEPYREAQIDALIWLIAELKKGGYAEAATNIFGHEEIARPLGRKQDPGPVFPWDKIGVTRERKTKRL